MKVFFVVICLALLLSDTRALFSRRIRFSSWPLSHCKEEFSDTVSVDKAILDATLRLDPPITHTTFSTLLTISKEKIVFVVKPKFRYLGFRRVYTFERVVSTDDKMGKTFHLKFVEQPRQGWFRKNPSKYFESVRLVISPRTFSATSFGIEVNVTSPSSRSMNAKHLGAMRSALLTALKRRVSWEEGRVLARQKLLETYGNTSMVALQRRHSQRLHDIVNAEQSTASSNKRKFNRIHRDSQASLTGGGARYTPSESTQARRKPASRSR